jgi:hypothetical protein
MTGKRVFDPHSGLQVQAGTANAVTAPHLAPNVRAIPYGIDGHNAPSRVPAPGSPLPGVSFGPNHPSVGQVDANKATGQPLNATTVQAPGTFQPTEGQPAGTIQPAGTFEHRGETSDRASGEHAFRGDTSHMVPTGEHAAGEHPTSAPLSNQHS